MQNSFIFFVPFLFSLGAFAKGSPEKGIAIQIFTEQIQVSGEPRFSLTARIHAGGLKELYGKGQDYRIVLYRNKKIVASRKFGYARNELIGSSVKPALDAKNEFEVVQNAELLIKLGKRPDRARLYYNKSVLKEVSITN